MNLKNLLFIGDVVGRAGTDFLASKLSLIKRHYAVDVTIVNGENSAAGDGITPESADMLVRAGADVITTGNHAFTRREATTSSVPPTTPRAAPRARAYACSTWARTR